MNVYSRDDRRAGRWTAIRLARAREALGIAEAWIDEAASQAAAADAAELHSVLDETRADIHETADDLMLVADDLNHHGIHTFEGAVGDDAP